MDDPFPLAPFDTSAPEEMPPTVEPPPVKGPTEPIGPGATDQGTPLVLQPVVPKKKYGPPRTASDVGGFGSTHSVCGFAYGDGSIHRFTSDITPDIYQRLGHRADGKLPPSGF